MDGKDIRNLLLMRCKRLAKLLEIDAPEALIYNDLYFIINMKSFFPKSMLLRLTAMEGEHKNTMGICCKKKCANKIDNVDYEKIGNIKCKSCAEQKLVEN